jgi:hypothetical protein
MSPPARLCVYRFDPGAEFEGGLVAAIERMQVLGDAKLLDALFVGREAETGMLQAIDLASASPSAPFASLLDFRLDADRRQALTERTLAEHPGGVPTAVVEAIADALPAGAAVLAVLHTGAEAPALDDAVTRAGGRALVAEPSDARALADAAARVRAAATEPD